MLGLITGFALVVTADAEDHPLSPTVMFDIPKQSLVTALQAYSAASGVAVLYESGVETGQYSAPVRGDLTREAALRELLGNTNIIVRYARSDAVTLQTQPPSIPTRLLKAFVAPRMWPWTYFM
ncbi:STN domain-containing protein [Mesorhizobium amorphae]|uniref:STN domain-containing protein n=1 Tax=Mesorhizobium amorphae TaxID=71433 RepID=UPI001184B5A7|nr:STN domain-containing protein [Mesorhizobium amorphae]